MVRRHSFIENNQLYLSRWLSSYIWQAVEHDLKKLHRISRKIGKNTNPKITEELKYYAEELMLLHLYTCQAEENHELICKKIRGETPGHY
jgi:hypothetical protein